MTITDSKCYETSGGTSLTGTVTAAEGDIVLATITTRDTTTLPSGWTQLYYSGVFAASGNGQRMYMIYKVADAAGTVSCLVSQASSQRLYINLISVSGYTVIEFFDDVIETKKSISAPDKAPGAVMIWGCSAAYWKTAAPYGDWVTSPSDLAVVSLDQASTAPRNGNFIDDGTGAATGRTITPNSLGSYSFCIAGVMLSNVITYEESGAAIYTSTAIQSITDYASSIISWVADVPEGTSITVSAACSTSVPADEDYLACTNGGTIPGLTGDLSTKTLYIKIAMSTTDTSITPSLSSMSITVNDASDANVISLQFDDSNRFRNVEGMLTVAYDSTIGNLAGEGGSVASFSESFAPTGLVQKPNIHDPEHIEITDISATGTLTEIFYADAQDDANARIEIANITASGTLTHIDDI